MNKNPPEVSSNPNIKNNLAVLILAAGLSRRLGQPKQLLLKNGQSLLRHSAELALTLKPQCIAVIINYTIDMTSELEDLPLQLVQNSQADTGMASSLKTGAEFLKNHRGSVLILGVDQPLLDEAYLQQLVQHSQQQPDMNIVSHYAQTIGIPAIVQSEMLQQGIGLSGDSGLKKLLMQQTNNIITVPAPQLAFDIDTPEQLAHARQQGWMD